MASLDCSSTCCSRDWTARSWLASSLDSFCNALVSCSILVLTEEMISLVVACSDSFCLAIALMRAVPRLSSAKLSTCESTRSCSIMDETSSQALASSMNC